MKKNLKDYILHLDKWIPKKICNKIIKELNKDKNWYRHNWTDSKSYKKYNIEKKELYTNNTQQLTDVKKLYDLVWKGLEKYIVVEKLGGEEFKGWVGFHQIRFNRYNKDQSIKKHVDHIHSLFDGEKVVSL